MDFDEGFAINKVYFAQSDLMTQAEIKTELGTNRLFRDLMKRIKRAIRNNGQKQKKDSINTEMH